MRRTWCCRTETASWNAYTTVRIAGDGPDRAAPGRNGARGGAAPDRPRALGGVLPIVPSFTAFPVEQHACTFALHPTMSDAKSAVRSRSRLAVIANAGPLIAADDEGAVPEQQRAEAAEASSRTTTSNRPGRRSGPRARSSAGVDASATWSPAATRTPIFTNISVSGNAVFIGRQHGVPVPVGTGGAVPIGGITGTLFGSSDRGHQLRSIITADNEHLFAEGA